MKLPRLTEQPERWCRPELAKRLDVSERMLDTDLRLICAAGYDVRWRHGSGYYRREQKEQPLP